MIAASQAVDGAAMRGPCFDQFRRELSIASSSVGGSCAPDTAVRPLKMKNGTPWMPTSGAHDPPTLLKAIESSRRN